MAETKGSSPAAHHQKEDRRSEVAAAQDELFVHHEACREVDNGFSEQTTLDFYESSLGRVSGQSPAARRQSETNQIDSSSSQ